MKITLRLIFFLVAAVALVAVVFSYWQVRQEEYRLKSDLEKRASVIADSFKIAVEPFLLSDNAQHLQRIVDKFSNRERLLGIAIHDVRENPVVVSTGFLSRLQANPGVTAEGIQEVERLGVEHGSFSGSGKEALYAHTVPLMTGDKISHALTLFYDTGYVRERVLRLWINSFWRVSIQAFLIALTTFLIIYLNVMAPIKKTTEWIKRVRKGEPARSLEAKEQLLLGPLAEEIVQMARSLETARLAAEEEARLRYSSESRWTPERLKEFVRLKLQDRPLVVVSNREPYMHIKTAKEIECIVPASGLVTALEPVLNACGGTWIAQGSGNADRETVDQHNRIRVPPQEPKYTLRRVWVDKDTEKGFYCGFSNEGLWPLCHIAHTRPIFRGGDWADYKAVNKKFAQAVLQELEGVADPYVLIQDYHFALLPHLIKSAKPDARVAIFWHIPWPNPESFGICPWYKYLLQGMLGADIVGFHTQFHCNNFIESVDRFLESRIDYEHFTINREGRTTWIKPFPISINFNPTEENSAQKTETRESLLKKYGLQAQWLGVGVDRLDYTKGILERFRAIENLLESHEAFRGKFTFVQMGAPSRTMIPKYKEFIDEIARETERINAKYKIKNWQPILLLMKHHSHQDILPFYKAADVCLVTSLHDGMNLVAKEFIAARDDERGVLVLSQFTGAARELRDALIVNPYDIGQTSEAIKTALAMTVKEQSERMKKMRNTVKENNVYRWAGALVNQLTEVRLGPEDKSA
ncbi:MAG: trehalose-6-phosphate synthase [Candidatus Omnitrophica bacterium]|nr:trehalose-6-phosphate synthase [Candidatus Omnitrophota bacterium]